MRDAWGWGIAGGAIDIQKPILLPLWSGALTSGANADCAQAYLICFFKKSGILPSKASNWLYLCVFLRVSLRVSLRGARSVFSDFAGFSAFSIFSGTGFVSACLFGFLRLLRPRSPRRRPVPLPVEGCVLSASASDLRRRGLPLALDFQSLPHPALLVLRGQFPA